MFNYVAFSKSEYVLCGCTSTNINVCLTHLWYIETQLQNYESTIQRKCDCYSLSALCMPHMKYWYDIQDFKSFILNCTNDYWTVQWPWWGWWWLRVLLVQSSVCQAACRCAKTAVCSGSQCHLESPQTAGTAAVSDLVPTLAPCCIDSVRCTGKRLSVTLMAAIIQPKRCHCCWSEKPMIH